MHIKVIYFLSEFLSFIFEENRGYYFDFFGYVFERVIFPQKGISCYYYSFLN